MGCIIYLKQIISYWTIQILTRIIYDKIYKLLKYYLDSKEKYRLLGIVNVIHGDYWFSNMMLYKGQLKCFDPRGKVGSKLTVKGNPVYDYAKLYQSIIGLDCII